MEKKILTLLMPITILITGLIFLMLMEPAPQEPEPIRPVILEQYTDTRNLTTVIFTDGKDTFGLDYLTPLEFKNIFDTVPAQIKPVTERPAIKARNIGYACPACLEYGCIYEDIDGRTTTGTDTDIQRAINEVAKERELTPVQIELLLIEYYL